MNNKVLIKLTCTNVYETFDLFIPVNEYIWKIKKLIVKSISEITRITLQENSLYVLINKDTGEMYDDNSVVINTNIRNGTELLLSNVNNF